MAKKSDGTKEWNTARMGISLLLNNKTEEAEALFTGHPHSFHMKAGRCFVLFMNALMTFENDKLQQAMLLLKDMERECASDIGWLKSMKSKVFKAEETGKDYVNKLERQIVLADSQVCSAILTLLQQELTGYVRGGWMLRKAWRVYQHAHSQILQLYQRTFGSNPSGFDTRCSTPSCNGSSYSLQSPHSPGSSEWSIPSCNGSTNNPTPISSPSGLRSSLSMFFSLTGITSEQQTPFVEPSEVSRLMSAVSFGYGIYQLCVSLLPPSLLKVIHFLGFEGDREAGITALMYARLSEDMRAPLATLSLLWYHTIARPFFALDGSNLRAGVNAAKQLIAECHSEFSNSALFLFFAGRIERLESNVNGALQAYAKAVEASSQREIKLLCLHEVAWCHLIRLSYEEAYRSLIQLHQQSRWSVSFYDYLATVCCGAIGKFDIVASSYRKVHHCDNRMSKETQLGLFVLRRTPKLVDLKTGQPYTVLYYRLLVYELLYLWNAMPSCSVDSLQGILLGPSKDQTCDYEYDPMNVRNTYCCANGGTCPAAILNSSRQSPWYCKFIKPFVFCIITSLLAMSVSHLCDKYSASTTFKIIRSDLVNLRTHLNTLSMEVKNVMETRDDLKSKLKEVGYVIPKMSEAILYLRNEVSEGMEQHTKALLKVMSPETVRELVKSELQTYDADKTGRTDYALGTSGGAILSTRKTETYSAGAPVLKLFGIPICQQQNTPHAIIQTSVLPGECWAFKGSSGSVVIQLLGFVHVSGVSLEHIPQSISPTGETSTAPRQFSILGLTSVDDTNSFFFGEFTYDNTGPPVQYFEVQNKPKKAYEIIELKVHSNSGNNEYTCIYRIRVHGTLSKKSR
ncbi:tetratricopeptide repeat protein 39C-like [Bombus affinis]|uniref:Tetratricopeptide repeat protein 39C n=1 Tax=Bombus terrestris TaxID=30195 RepID=A0A9C6SJ41_BOMTE|nr:tetratricopeptide repeat protein 39C [Bombus terrestris]XP_050580718.1 tetratricopeptide repeat protein 39C-like [Bombus affinis]